MDVVLWRESMAEVEEALTATRRGGIIQLYHDGRLSYGYKVP